MSFDTTAKRRYLPAANDSLMSGHSMRSPENSLYTKKEFTNNLTTSINKSHLDTLHRKNSTTIIHPVSQTTFKSPTIDDSYNADSRTKNASPKKYYFFSEYMKDFNPTPKEYKSPTFRNSKASVLDTQTKNIPYISASYSKGIFSQKESVLITTARGRSPDIISPRGPNTQKLKDYLSPQRIQTGLRDDSANLEKKLKENKKEDIRNRLSHLSEKFYSPGRSISLIERRKSEVPDEVLERAFPKESHIPVKDYSNFLTQENITENVEGFEKPESDYRAQAQVAIENLDVKYQVMVQEYEHSMENLKTHLEKVEQDNTDIVNKLREELITSQEQVNRHRIESFSKGGDESGNFGLNYELEDQLRQERSKNRQLETKLEDTKTYYEKKLADLNREIEKVKIEKEKKNDEINNLLRSKTQSQRDIINKIKTENEAIIKKLREEHNFAVKEFHAQLERKNNELEKVQREKGELLNDRNEKNYALQELTRSNQESHNKLNQTITFKDNEIEKLSRMLNDAKKAYSTVNNKSETLERERVRLEEENERLQSKAARLEKMIYGKDKETSPRFG